MFVMFDEPLTPLIIGSFAASYVLINYIEMFASHCNGMY